MASEKPDKPLRRRDFFRRGLLELFKPLDKALEPVKRVARQFDALDRGIVPGSAAAGATTPNYSGSYYANSYGSQAPWSLYSSDPVYLRPPGAQPEEQFVNTCSHCSACVKVCPVQCIKIDPAGQSMGGAPYIDVDDKACVMCDGVLCAYNCPSGALMPTVAVNVKLGTAVWNESLCVRTTGQPCTICVDKCPVGPSAIQLIDGRIAVQTAGCTGCGVCQHECPTSPKSIRICPRDQVP
jgi:ferredoxin-type protein NapG